MTKEEFDKAVVEWALDEEHTFNTGANFRCHVKETEQEAD